MMKHTRFKDCLHYLLGYLGIHTEYSDRIETETRLRLLLSNQTSIKCELLSGGYTKKVRVTDWAEVYVLFQGLINDKKADVLMTESQSIFKANGLTLTRTYSMDKYLYALSWESSFRLDKRINGLQIVTTNDMCK